MGTLEHAAKQKRRRVAVEQAIIDVLATAVLAGVVVAAPNAVQLLKYVDLGVIGARDPRRRVSESVSRLRRKGLVEWSNEKSGWRLRLTTKGRERAAASRMRMMRMPRPKRWDGRWRFVMFDIPEPQRAMRRKVRELVRELGFCRFQDSVWAYPYDCEEVITLLKLEIGTGNKLLYLIADAVEYDAPLRRHFGLPADKK